MRVSVVIPCHNEEDSIEKVIRAVPPEVAEILVVDNNSTDRTADIARAHGARVVEETQQGYGPALACGFRNATGDIIATLDGDNQYPPYMVMKIAEHLVANNLDFISAARFPLDDTGSMPFVRRFGNWGLTLATNVLFLLSLRDAQSGMWIFRKSALAHLKLEQTKESKGMSLTQEIKVRAAIHPDIRFAEYHIPYHPRLGESKLNPFRDGWRMLMFLLKLRLETLGK
ncbi:MAG: glycosyltransferase family 2 protein [Candidatus Liptonbacteria bacterium]|nr:glycosyltransferase family 2 protein [Candidatus Liptonbacteria bacterium]